MTRFTRTISVAFLALSAAACGTQGISGNAVFFVGKGWDQDNTVPIAQGSVFEATARETGAFGAQVRLESDNTAIIAPKAGGTSDEFEAVGTGKVFLVARTDAGTELDRIEFEVAAPTAIDAAYWTDLSLDTTSRLGSAIAAVGNSDIELKLLVTDAAGRTLRHLGVAALISDGAPVNIAPNAQTKLSIGATGQGGFSAKITAAGAPILKKYTVEILAESDVTKLTVANGPVAIGEGGEGAPQTSDSGSTAHMHLMFARCEDSAARRVFGCKPTWTRVQGTKELWLKPNKKTDFNWVELDVGEAVTVKATLGGLNVTKTVEYDVTAQ